MTATLPKAISFQFNGTFSAVHDMFEELPELPAGIRPKVSLEFNDGAELNLLLNNQFVTIWKQNDETCNSYDNSKWDNRNEDNVKGPGPWDDILTSDQVADVLTWGEAVYDRIDIMVYHLLTQAATDTFTRAATAFATEDAEALNIPGVTLEH